MVVYERYQALGGEVQVIQKPGVDHHPHGLENPAPVIKCFLDAVREQRAK